MSYYLTDFQIKQYKERGYSERAIDLIQERKNIGLISNPDLQLTQIGSCGDLMTIFVKLSEDKVIDDIKFKYIGCPALAASGSSMTELSKGKKVLDAIKLEPEEILEDLGGLPESHMHCPILAVKSLKNALAILIERKNFTKEEHDRYIHHCGLTGIELENLSSIPCSCCQRVRECELDHIIIGLSYTNFEET